MNVSVHHASENVEFEDDDLNHLIDTLVKAYGASLPEAVDEIMDGAGEGRYELRLNDSSSFGNAFGECLVTNGWSIIGFHDDRVTVMRSDLANLERTVMHTEGDRQKVEFSEI